MKSITKKALHFLLPALLLCGAAPAQEEQPRQAPSAEEIQARIEAIGASEMPDQEAILASYDQALREIDRKKELESRAVEFERKSAEIPALTEALNEELASPPVHDEPTVPPESSLKDLERLLQEAEANRTAARKLADDLDSEVTHRPERVKVVNEELVRVRGALTEKETALRTVGTLDELGKSRESLLLAELEALRAEERALVSERAFLEARREVSPLLQDQARRGLERSDQLFQFWQDQVTNRRQEEADAAVLEVERQRRELATKSPALSEIAGRNAELAAKRSGEEGVPVQLSLAAATLAASEALLDEVTRRFRATRRKVDVAGLSDTMGKLLRLEHDWIESQVGLLPDPRAGDRALSRAQLLRITLEEEREAVGDIATHHEQLLVELAGAGLDASEEELSSLVRELLVTQRELHDALIAGLGKLIDTGIEATRVEGQLRAALAEYGAYIGERILWVPSTEGGLLPKISSITGGLAWLGSPSEWSKGLERAGQAAGQESGSGLLLGFLFLGLLLFRRWIRRVLVGTAAEARSVRTDRYGLTVRAVLSTLALALPFPLLVGVIGWLLAAPEEQVEVARAVGLALQEIAPTYLVLEFLRQAASAQGLGVGHFRWYPTGTSVLRRELRWYVPVALSLEFLVITFDNQKTADWNDAVGRILFVGILAAFIVVVCRLFRPDTGMLVEYYRRTSGLLERTQKLWLGLALLVPLVLLFLTLAGFYYSALRYNAYLSDSILLAISLVLVNALLLRWLFITRRRLAVEQARQRAEAKAQSVEVAGDAPALEFDAMTFDEEAIDIPAVDAQTRKLIRSGILMATLLGLFSIWSGVFPALRALDEIQIWPKFQIGDNQTFLDETRSSAVPSATTTAAAPSLPAADAVAASAAVTTPVGVAGEASIITLADLLVALVVFVLTWVAARDGPAVLEISVLQRLPVDSGSRHAISTLFRYGILIIGLTIGFGAIGIGWDKIQWLAAAMTFGLAFGLQEIFANFVSGIIILLERPVRVGDMVTVGGTEGRVTRLRMRSTTILDWDRREFLIPNKEFITGSIVNWTLSDPVTRVVVPVGIAYGSDTQTARELLMKTAKENRLVLEEPAPSAIFRGFGDSTLDFELRVFINNRNLWPELIDRLHTQIDASFRAAGVVIAFPQRDLHIHSAEGPRQGDAKQTGLV